MAEPQKGTSSSANPKEKSSFLDEEIGNEFLSSWKSMSVMKDDGMDFSFDTVPKGKKKVFDFEKLDMDFNLDGDFNKLSSFKVDMSDLDFSSPPKKAAKTKEKSEEEPSKGNHQGKQDQFKFSFDFNELDNFDFDSSLTKREKSSKKNQDSSKEVVSDRTGCQGSKINLADGVHTLDGNSERVATSKADTMLVDPGNVNSMNDGCASKPETSGNLKLPHFPRSPEKIMTMSVEESDQKSHLSEKAMPTEPYVNQATHDLPSQLVGGVDSNGETVLEGRNDGCSQFTKGDTISSGKENVNDQMLTGDGPNPEDSPLKDSASSGSNNDDRSTDISTENSEPSKGDLEIEENSNTFVSRKTPVTLHNIKSVKEDQNSTVKLPLSTQGSESTIDKVTLTNESEAGEFHSKNSRRLEDSGSQLYQPLLKGAKCLSSGSKRIGTMHLRPAIEKGVGVNPNDAQIGSKLLPTPTVVDRETRVKHVIPGRDGFNSDAVPNGTEMVGDSRLCDKEVTEKEPVLGSEQRKNLDDLRHVEISCSIQASPSISTEKKTKPSTQTCVNPKLMLSKMESMRNTKIITAEGNKLYPDQPAKKKTDLSTWKISKNIDGNKVSLNAAPQKQVKSQRNSEKNMEVQGKVELKTAQIVDGSEKQMPLNLSLKRKTFEGSNSGLSSLKPLKRLSESPKENRNFKEPSKEVVEEQVFIHENHLESKTKSTFYDHPTSGLGSPCEVNVMELEFPLVMENDGNVEKAEAYTKELEDICNMLKKKHEEAKEMLVRAIVNNNNLLMLNHPIYEAKIHKVQKFAAKLVSKELQACSRGPTVVI